LRQEPANIKAIKGIPYPFARQTAHNAPKNLDSRLSKFFVINPFSLQLLIQVSIVAKRCGSQESGVRSQTYVLLACNLLKQKKELLTP